MGDPVVAELFGYGSLNYSGEPVSEMTALNLSAVYRSVNLIAGTIASLPLQTLTVAEGRRQTVRSFLDNPAGAASEVGLQTPFSWKETVVLHLLLHGDAFLLHRYGGAGQLIGLLPVHPSYVTVEWNDRAPGGKLYKIHLDGREPLVKDARGMTQVMGPSLDRLRGMSPIRFARNSLGTALAGDRSAARMFRNGGAYNIIVTPEEDVTKDEAETIKADLQAKMTGPENAGEIAVINRKLKLSPWSMSAEDAQFLQSRTFQIEEIGRWWGVPPHLLGLTEKSTSWGTGLSEQNRGLARHVLMPWTLRLQEALSTLVENPRLVEFDFSGYLKPSPEDEVRLLIEQIDSGLLTLNEARAQRNLPPVEGGDIPRQGFAQPVQSDQPNQLGQPENTNGRGTNLLSQAR
ncbi:phage portal protein [Prauserella shujinwangii]|nr:phage portal protein [Prauserella shujinwangii]